MPQKFQSPMEYQQQVVRQLELIRQTLERMYEHQLRPRKREEISERQKLLLQQFQNLNLCLTRHGLTQDQHEKISDRHPASRETSPGPKDSSTTPASSTAQVSETYHLLTPHLSIYLRPHLESSIRKGCLPASLVVEAQELIKFASAAEESQGS